ncbi:MAG: hypothetical protein H0T42_27845 [Deltaproteobacteria bacterium]|nr:hypothetical protein [Deltaproteobacteria bacterium]
MRAAALVLLAACGGTPAISPPSHTTTSHSAPSTTPPEVRFESLQLTGSGLPAITADGASVVYAVVDGDGGRGNPNLALVIKDRKDRELERFVVVTPNESEGQYDDRGPSAALIVKIDAADRWLAKLHARSNLRSLSTQGIVVELGSRLTIHARGALVVDIATPASWSVPDKKLCTTCEDLCRHPMFVGAAHADLDRRIVLLTVSYSGTDLCPEPVSQHHVLTW